MHVGRALQYILFLWGGTAAAAVTCYFLHLCLELIRQNRKKAVTPASGCRKLAIPSPAQK